MSYDGPFMEAMTDKALYADDRNEARAAIKETIETCLAQVRAATDHAEAICRLEYLLTGVRP